MSRNLLTPSLVALDVDLGEHTDAVIDALTGLVAAVGRAGSDELLARAVKDREATSPTGVPGGVAIPHCRSAVIREPTLVFARLTRPVHFGAPDGPADLIFLIVAPTDADQAHLQILSRLARGLLKADFLTTLRSATSPTEVIAAVAEVLGPTATGADIDQRRRERAAESVASEGGDPGTTRIVAVTACPTGIAHTYMAADALQQTAAKRGDIRLIVETQGSASRTRVDPALIEAADVIILAADIEVIGRERFAGKRVVETGVRRALEHPAALLDLAVRRAGQADGDATETPGGPAPAPREWGHWLLKFRQAVMTGVGYMIPFVAAGGLLTALGLLAGGPNIAAVWSEIITGYSLAQLPGQGGESAHAVLLAERSGWLVYLGAALYGTGQLAMNLIVPALSGFIAFGLAGRPGIAPGFIGGAVSLFLGAGFIGALVTGVLGGLIAQWVGRWQAPRVLRSLLPVVLIPLLSTLVVGLAMFWLLGRPLGNLMSALTAWLATMSGTSAMLLGAVLGMMMCLDLGGPLNKTAYLFATAGLSTGDAASLQVMAAVMAAGMVPPLAMSLATLLRPGGFTWAERENGKSAWLLGLTFVTEGAIPFAAADPLRVIPAVMTGGATAGAVAMGLQVASPAPHGGLLVVFAIDPWWGLLLAVAAGTLTAVAAVLTIKAVWRRPPLPSAPRLPHQGFATA
ncbi:PTS fructose transporter subunit IIABC [Corynebacterium halotolerans]|uniref:PTS fructose transporter subunit IIABC n=1 Tax=Corynebacterium halotolerans TaxID=225326 RepID=UPI003CFBA8DD